MALTPEKIRELLAKKAKPRSGGTRSGGKKIDPDDRSYQAWFALNHMLIDQETQDRVFCDNPNCLDRRDDRTTGQVVVEINGRKLCRYCFIDGWLTTQQSASQTTTDRLAG